MWYFWITDLVLGIESEVSIELSHLDLNPGRRGSQAVAASIENLTL